MSPETWSISSDEWYPTKSLWITTRQTEVCSINWKALRYELTCEPRYLSLISTRQDLTQDQWPEGRLKWGLGERKVEHGWGSSPAGLWRPSRSRRPYGLKSTFIGLCSNQRASEPKICHYLPQDRTRDKVNEPKVDYSGDLGEEKVGHESRLEPCWTVLVINPLSSMWA